MLGDVDVVQPCPATIEGAKVGFGARWQWINNGANGAGGIGHDGSLFLLSLRCRNRYPVTMTSLHEAGQAALAGLKTGYRILGLDLGTKTIGMATADLKGRIGTPRETLARNKFMLDAKLLLGFMAREYIGLIVIGLPLNMDGTEGARAQSTRAFVRNFSKLTDVPIVFWDERLSTVAVTRVMLEADLSRAKRAENVDKLAAAYILQSFLDACA